MSELVVAMDGVENVLQRASLDEDGGGASGERPIDLFFGGGDDDNDEMRIGPVTLIEDTFPLRCL